MNSNTAEERTQVKLRLAAIASVVGILATVGTATDVAASPAVRVTPMEHRWAHSPSVITYIHLDDRVPANANWDVPGAVRLWNHYLSAYHIPMRFTRGCGRGDVCIPVRSVRACPRDGSGADCLLGFAAVTYTLPARIVIAGSVQLYVNQWLPSGRDARRATVEHELGHIIGLGHSPISTDMMYWAPDVVGDRRTRTPSGLDLWALRRAYC